MKPRLAFVGLGWIGQARLRSLVEADAGTPVAYLEPHPANLAAAHEVQPASVAEDLDGLLDMRPDGVVIASPNRMHADQARAAAEHGVPVFCQKPLSDRHQAAEATVRAAEGADVLLRVDWSYRGTRALQAMRNALHEGAIGSCYRAELSFHNAYGPDKAWYRDPALAGGGCLLDLGCHLLDALQWLLPEERYHVTGARLYKDGVPARPGAIEDHAIVHLDGTTSTAHVQSSWNVPTGGDAEIGIRLYGPKGVLRFSNLGGSFFDFQAELLQGTRARPLCRPPDAWGGRQIIDWAHEVASGATFHPEAWQIAENARLLEDIYACAS